MANYDLKKIYEWPTPMQFVAVIFLGLFIFYLGYLIDLTSLTSQFEINTQQESQIKASYKATLQEQISTVSATQQLPQLKQKLAAWKTNFIASTEMPQLQNDILKLGESNQLKISDFNPGAPTKMNGFTMLPIKLLAVGTFQQISNYMSQVANIGKTVVIGNFEIEGQSVSGNAEPTAINSSNPVNATLTIELYEK